MLLMLMQQHFAQLLHLSEAQVQVKDGLVGSEIAVSLIPKLWELDLLLIAPYRAIQFNHLP